MLKKIAELEGKLSRTGSLVKINPKDAKAKHKTFWIGWYKPDGEEDYRLVTPTISISEEDAQKKIDKLIEGVCECGVGQMSADGKVNIITKPDESNVEDKISDLILKKISSNILKNASEASQIDIKDFVIFDTETTGLSAKDEIVEIAAIKFTGGKPVGSYHSYIVPTIPVPRAASNIHGLTEDFLRKEGNQATHALGGFFTFLGDHPACAHNFKFDKRMVENHCKKIGMKVTIKKGFCTLELSRIMMALTSHKLESIIDTFDLRKGLNSHNAIDDVKATARYAHLLNRVYKHSCVKVMG